jgi:hypothetical protein
MTCDACHASFRWLQMTKSEPLPSCPNPNCKGAVQQELAAPGVARGAAPETSWKVPQTRAGREKFAYEMAEGMGFTNMKDNLREGDVQAPPAPVPTFTADNGRTMKLDGAGFANAATPEGVTAAIQSALGTGSGAGVNRHALHRLNSLKGR